jgi:aconitate decarboxylase
MTNVDNRDQPVLKNEKLNVMISGGFSGAYEKLLPEFERTSGIKVKTESGASQGAGPQTIAAQLARGVPADVVILSTEGLEELIATKQIVAGTDVDLARVPLGVAVQAGTAKPDVSTVEAFKQALLKTKTVAIASTSGIWLMNDLFPRLGIAEEINAKITPRGADAAGMVAAGAADLAIMPVSEIVHAGGVDLAGHLAPEIQFVQTFSAGIVAGSGDIQASKRLIDFLASPRASETIGKSGMEPLAADRRDGAPGLRARATVNSMARGNGHSIEEDIVTKANTHRTEKISYAATDPEGPTGRLATWLAQARLEDVPLATREHAKHLLLDGIGCALVGAQLPVSRRGVEAITALDDAGKAPLIGWNGRSTSAPSAAMLNSSFIQGFELDDYHPLAPLHSNSLVIPAMLGVISHVKPASGNRFLLGAILGYETGPRVGLALGGLEMLSRGWHSGVVFGTLSAAASAGCIYGLNAGQFEDALGIAATQSCGLMSAQFESMVKRMQHGFASRAGLTAAALAVAGYVGIKRVFEREYGGWLGVFGEGHHPDASQIYANLGAKWETDRIAVKAYAAMGLLHAAIGAALKLRSEVKIDQIERVDVFMPEAAYGHGGWKAVRPLEPIGAQMNVAYAVAAALLDGQVLVEQFSAKRINQDDVWNLINRTRTHHERAYDQLPLTDRLTTRVRLTLKDGSTKDKVVAHPRGTGERALTNDEIVAKYRSLTRSIIPADRQSAIEKIVLDIDALEDISELIALLTPSVRPALE